MCHLAFYVFANFLNVLESVRSQILVCDLVLTASLIGTTRSATARRTKSFPFNPSRDRLVVHAHQIRKCVGAVSAGLVPLEMQALGFDEDGGS